MDALLKHGFGIGGKFERTLSPSFQSCFNEGSDEWGMELALVEAMNSIGISSPNPGVGCVIARDRKVIARGFTQEYKKEHAERMALKSLPIDAILSGATAYVTLEPCTHVGFQPPCIDLLLGSSISKVVIGSEDPFPKVNGQGIQRLRDAGKEVVVGVLQNEVRAWLYPFLRSLEKRSPVWIAKWAQTPSGYLADHEGHSKWITNEKSRAYTHWLRQKYDVIVVGASTFLADHPELTVRDCAYPIQHQPRRFVFDPSGRVLNSGLPLGGFTLLVCESKIKKKLSGEVSVVSIEGSPEQPELMQRMKRALESAEFERPLQSVMVEGGAQLLNGLLTEDLLDVVHCFTGIKEFSLNNPKYQVRWTPTSNWIPTSHQKFDDDDLREWVKGVLMS